MKLLLALCCALVAVITAYPSEPETAVSFKSGPQGFKSGYYYQPYGNYYSAAAYMPHPYYGYEHAYGHGPAGPVGPPMYQPYVQYYKGGKLSRPGRELIG
uniref:Secreted protein n=1 Tax=Steinernema glaseri TaxID=37863 RepID=A0A1I7Y3M2_9BILA